MGNITYGLTDFPTPNGGQYSGAYFAPGANVIYLLFSGVPNTNNNWIVPYKINGDGSVTAGAYTNLGANPSSGVGGAMVADSTGNYLYVAQFSTVGIKSYSIGLNGALTLFSGPIYAGNNFNYLLMNAENTILIGENTGTFATAVISSGTMNPASSMASGCAFGGPTILDPSEKYLYVADVSPTPNTLCGLTLGPTGLLGTISGQSYPLPITGSADLATGFAIQMSSP